MEVTNSQYLDGLYGSHISRSKAVGYCYKHHAHLTTTTLKRKECLKKNCHALKKHEEHDYWRQREQKKEMKKVNKMLREVV